METGNSDLNKPLYVKNSRGEISASYDGCVPNGFQEATETDFLTQQQLRRTELKNLQERDKLKTKEPIKPKHTSQLVGNTPSQEQTQPLPKKS